MAVEVQFLFWPSVILSVVGSIVLTAVFYFLSKRNSSQSYDDFYDGNNEYNDHEHNDHEYDEYRKNDRFDSNDGDSSSEDFDSQSQIKTGGVILIGPIPIAFGNGGIRFDKKNFKYALLFFLIAVLVYLMMVWIISK
ncbi:hypothetical protein MsAg5_09630 [Methanosarcinaceae archaeon Ag5]|uniref:DUF131 domain-containing protein n=1 Tax=Methanolapillus africanus TaxID=3028297 RepID=A0AAE4MJ50_9EURY|nr:hypothetical protein [Methanosarcinaceae archaeon Ag5]